MRNLFTVRMMLTTYWQLALLYPSDRLGLAQALGICLSRTSFEPVQFLPMLWFTRSLLASSLQCQCFLHKLTCRIMLTRNVQFRHCYLVPGMFLCVCVNHSCSCAAMRLRIFRMSCRSFCVITTAGAVMSSEPQTFPTKLG